jgi:hypothetical protein
METVDDLVESDLMKFTDVSGSYLGVSVTLGVFVIVIGLFVVVIGSGTLVIL